MFGKPLLTLAIFVGLILLNRWIFATLFGIDYLIWYISKGSLISLGITFISLVAKEFKKDIDTVSANPLTYLATYLRYPSIAWYMFATLMHENTGLGEKTGEQKTVNEKKDELGDAQPSFDPVSALWHLIDSLLLLIWAAVLFMGVILWVVVVVPLQYFVFLICGAPARYFQATNFQVVVVKKDEKLTLTYIKGSEKIPENGQVVGLGIEPLPLTNLICVLFFEAVKVAIL